MILARDPHDGQQSEINFLEALRAKRDQYRAQAARVGDQPADLHAHAAWRERLQVIRAALQLDRRATVVVTQQMVAADTNLQDALVECPDRTWLGVPDQLQRLVALKVFAPVELLDPAQKTWRGRLAAATRNILPIRRIM